VTTSGFPGSTDLLKTSLIVPIEQSAPGVGAIICCRVSPGTACAAATTARPCRDRSPRRRTAAATANPAARPFGLDALLEHTARAGYRFLLGHLAATLSTGFAEPVYAPVDSADAASARPFAAALIYPVVTMAVPGTHPMSRELLLGPNPTPSQVARRSAELHVGVPLR
jgi:hypothetical protein